MNFISHIWNRTLKRFNVVLQVFINILYINIDIYNILKTSAFLYYHLSICELSNNIFWTELSREIYLSFFFYFFFSLIENYLISIHRYLSWRIFTKCVWKQQHLFIEVCAQQEALCGDFPDFPVVKTLSSNAEGVGSIPGEIAKIPHTTWPKKQNIKQKQYCNKFSKDFKRVHIKRKQAL